MPVSYLTEDDNWVSVKFGAQFARKVSEKTGDPEIYRKIGHFYFSPENLNPFEYSLLRSLSPYLVLKSAEQFYRKRNVACNFKLINEGWGKYKFEMSSDQELYPEMAHNTLGILEAFQKVYDLDLFSVELDSEKSETIHRFSLTMSFAAFNFYLKRAMLWGSVILLGLLFGFILWRAEEAFGITLIPFLSGLTYLFGFLSYKLSGSLKIFRRSTEEYYAKVREKNQNLYEKAQLLERRYQEANLLKNLSTELVGCKDPHGVIETCLKTIRLNFDYKRAAVFLISKERGKIYLANSIGFEGLSIDASKVEFVFPNPDKKEGFVATAIENGETVLVHDIESYKSILKPQNKALLEALNVGSLIISPIQSSDKKFGAFALIREVNEPLLDKQDRFLIENITSQLSLYFESASNYENEVKLRSIFQKYVPPTVLEQLSDRLSTSDGTLAPKKVEICSVFMDLRGFTSACDGAAPERAFALINMFAEFATKHLAAQGAIVDNIIGDEIVCFFTKDPHQPTTHVERALKAAQSIQEHFPELNAKLKLHGFPHLKLGIGLHCGEASVGSVGSDAKMNFTALGSTVNVASRLQALTKKFAVEDVTIIVSDAVLDTLKVKSRFAEKIQREVLRGTSDETLFAVVSREDLASISLRDYAVKKAA
jgi:class 3 adenylate cyclase